MNLDEIVEKISRFELTRKEAAAQIGVPYSTFITMLKRHGAIEKLEYTRTFAWGKKTNPLSRPQLTQSYEDAVRRALAEPGRTVKDIWKETAGLNYRYLLERVRQARLRRGL